LKTSVWTKGWKEEQVNLFLERRLSRLCVRSDVRAKSRM
jgi:hypothetical protein